MKKKLMMVAVLLGALSLGACVDDNESQSVIDVRNAKAEQLKSIAALNNAQAEALLIAAKAEQALKEAEAKYQEALAEAKKAEAAYQAELTEQAKQKFAEELKLIQAEYAAKIAFYNDRKQYYENELWGKTESHLNKVYSYYTSALDNVNTYTEEKMKQQVLKASTEAQVITAEESLKQTLAGLNNQKAEAERNLAKWEEMKKAQPSKDEYRKQLDELEKQAYDLLQNKLPAATAAEADAKEAFSDAKDAMSDTENSFADAAEALKVLVNKIYNYNYTYRPFVTSEGKYWAEKERDDFLDEFGESVEGRFYYSKYILMPESGMQYATIAADKYFADRLQNSDDAIKNAEGEAWKKDAEGHIIPNWSDVESVNGAQGFLDWTNDQIKIAEANIKAWQAAIDAEKKKPAADQDQSLINDNTNKIEDANDAIKEHKANIPTREADITAAKEKLQKAKDEKVEIEVEQKEYQANLKTIKDAAAQKAYEDMLEKVEPAAVAYVEKQAETARLENARDEIGITNITSDGTITKDGGQYGDISELMDGIVDVQKLIDGCNTTLAEIAAQIQLGDLNHLVSLRLVRIQIYNPVMGEYEYAYVYNYTITGSGITLENAIALIDAKIKSLDEKIRVESALAEKYKAELDALLK